MPFPRFNEMLLSKYLGNKIPRYVQRWIRLSYFLAFCTKILAQTNVLLKRKCVETDCKQY